MVNGAPLVEVDGGSPSPDDLSYAALVNYGHFTAMQVRCGAVRGLDLHLNRLRDAHRELFGSEVDSDRVRRFMRQAVAQQTDAYLRVTLYERVPGLPLVMTVVRPAVEAPARPQLLTDVSYVRPFPHIKHVGSFAQIRYGLLAERGGFDDAVLVTPDGHIAETTMSNIGFVDGESVVWPAAPCLRGITWQLLDAALAEAGHEVRTEVVPLAGLARFDAAFVANSIGVSSVGRIGAHEFAAAHQRVDEMVSLYANVRWDVI